VTLPRPTPVSVFCVDDHADFRDVLCSLVAATPGFRLVGQAASGEEAIIVVPTTRPDLVLMDVNMPGMGGLRAAEILASGRRDLVIALISADPVELSARVAAHGGEIVFVDKPELSSRRLLDLWHGRRTR
jgi:two-component system, NarL family, invasion response regulator UvrY